MEEYREETGTMKNFRLRAAACVLAAATAISMPASPSLADTAASSADEDSGSVTITIEQGDGTIAVAEKLKDAGVISSTTLFRLRAKISGADDEWKPGEYTVDKDAGSSVIDDLTEDHAGEIRVTIPEGKQAKQAAQILEEAGVCGADEFIDACQNHTFDYEFLDGIDTSSRISGLEGYLYPDTYYFEPDSDPDTVIQKMLDRFEEKVYTDEIRQEAADMNFSIDDLVKLASMVESEATTESDRKLVAGVFLNRLNDGWKLQSCVTVEYAKGIKKAIISYEDTQYDSPYNTYLYSGLPYGPICCPGQESIEAVLNSTPSNYYYFQSDSSGNLHFAETFAEHAAIQEDVQSNWDTN